MTRRDTTFVQWHYWKFYFLNYSHKQYSHTMWITSLQCMHHGIFIRYIRSLDLVGAFEKMFTLASHYATVCCMVRPWSRTQVKSRCRRKEHRNRKVVYLKLIKQVSIFLNIFREQFYSNSREDCCKAIKQKLCFWLVNIEVCNTQATELVGFLSQEASMSDICCLPSSE